MDLVAGVRKEGSRGGRNEFKWSDVKDSTHRENYLGHSLMAPVGRWQQGRDLQWYAKGDVDDEEERLRKEHEERQLVKNAEEEAMARALGLPLPPTAEGVNANMVPLGGPPKEGGGEASEERKRHRSRSPRRDRRRERSRDGRGRDKERRHRRHRDDNEDRYHRSRRHRSTSRSRSRGRDPDRYRPRSRSRSRSPHARKEDHRSRRMDRSYSPGERRRRHERRENREDADRRR